MSTHKSLTNEQVDLWTKSGISPLICVRLDFRAWQWSSLLQMNEEDLIGKHLWVQPAGSEVPQALKEPPSLLQLFASCRRGKAGAGLLNLDLAIEIDSRREELGSLFDEGAVWPHAGDYQAVKRLGFDMSKCYWFTTQKTPGTSGEHWNLLRQTLRLNPRRIVVQDLHDAANLIGIFQTARSRRPEDSWTHIAEEILEDFKAAGPDTLKIQLNKAQSDLQRFYEGTIQSARPREDSPPHHYSSQEDFQILLDLAKNLENLLEDIATLLDPLHSQRRRCEPANLDKNLEDWRYLLSKAVRISV